MWGGGLCHGHTWGGLAGMGTGRRGGRGVVGCLKDVMEVVEPKGLPTPKGSPLLLSPHLGTPQ